MGYKIYSNSDKHELHNPHVHKTRELGNLEAWRTFITTERQKCAVLVYATGQVYQALKAEEITIPVTEATPWRVLETMDSKIGSYYPVFMIDDRYGGRGLNFRAQYNPHGITLLILGSFVDEKTMKQVLQRVGRWKDKCNRVRDSTFEMYDHQRNAERKGRIEKFLHNLREQKFKAG